MPRASRRSAPARSSERREERRARPTFRASAGRCSASQRHDPPGRAARAAPSVRSRQRNHSAQAMLPVVNSHRQRSTPKREHVVAERRRVHRQMQWSAAARPAGDRHQRPARHSAPVTHRHQQRKQQIRGELRADRPGRVVPGRDGRVRPQFCRATGYAAAVRRADIAPGRADRVVAIASASTTAPASMTRCSGQTRAMRRLQEARERSRAAGPACAALQVSQITNPDSTKKKSTAR